MYLFSVCRRSIAYFLGRLALFLITCKNNISIVVSKVLVRWPKYQCLPTGWNTTGIEVWGNQWSCVTVDSTVIIRVCIRAFRMCTGLFVHRFVLFLTIRPTRLTKLSHPYLSWLKFEIDSLLEYLWTLWK